MRDDHAQQLHDDRRRDVRHDAQREDGELEQRATAEQVHELVEAAGALVGCEAGLHVAEVDERRGNERSQAEEGDDAQSEPDLTTKVGRAEDPRDGAKHKASWCGVKSAYLRIEPAETAPVKRADRDRLDSDRCRYYLTDPPAATIFCSAEPETLSTVTFSLTAMSPLPRTLTFSFLRTAPLATRSVTVTSPPFG